MDKRSDKLGLDQCIQTVNKLETHERLDRIIEKLEAMTKVEETKNAGTKNMGLGDLAKPGIVFPREFRWTVEADSTRLEYYAKCVEYSYTTSTLQLELFEFIDPTSGQDCPVDEWIRKLMSVKSKENITITMFDGCGQALYETKFYEVRVLSHSLPLDYGKSDIVTHKVTLKYKKSERNFLLGKVQNERRQN